MDDREFLFAVREYIESAEVSFDAEYEGHRSLDEIIADGDMPSVYGEVLRRIGCLLSGANGDE